MKKKAFNFFATVAVNKYVYVDDTMTPVDSEDMAYGSTFELYLEYGNNHFAKIDLRQDRGTPRQDKRNERDAPEHNQHNNEGKRSTEHLGARADFQTT
eukprot:2724668-Heterocapsa_arctica.AAC.1